MNYLKPTGHSVGFFFLTIHILGRNNEKSIKKVCWITLPVYSGSISKQGILLS